MYPPAALIFSRRSMMGWATCFENEETGLTICFVKPLPRVLRIFFLRGFIGSDLPRVVKVNYLGAPVGHGDTVVGLAIPTFAPVAWFSIGFDPISIWLQPSRLPECLPRTVPRPISLL